MVPLDLLGLGRGLLHGQLPQMALRAEGGGIPSMSCPDRQEFIHPLSISHGFNSRCHDRSRYLIEFGWTGTSDPTAALSVAEALRFMGGLLPGGWPEIMARNRNLALEARNILCQTLQISAPCPDECIGSMAAVPLPDNS